jgi:hypothetical protein
MVKASPGDWYVDVPSFWIAVEGVEARGVPNASATCREQPYRL